MEFKATGEVIEWRGPAPHHVVRVSGEVAAEFVADVAHLSYGWGCTPAEVTAGDTTVTTSPMPRDDG